MPQCCNDDTTTFALLKCKENEDVERWWHACKETTTQTYALMQRDVLGANNWLWDTNKWWCWEMKLWESGFKDAHRTWMCVQCWMARNGWDRSAKHGDDDEAQETRPY